MQSYDSDIHSPNDMMIDPQDDMVVEPAQDDRDQVAIIEPDPLDNEPESLENVTLATDCTLLSRPHPLFPPCCRPTLTASYSRGHKRDRSTHTPRGTQHTRGRRKYVEG